MVNIKKNKNKHKCWVRQFALLTGNMASAGRIRSPTTWNKRKEKHEKSQTNGRWNLESEVLNHDAQIYDIVNAGHIVAKYYSLSQSEI